MACLLDAALNDVALVPEAGNRPAQLPLELGEITTADIPQLDVFEVVPNALVGVQIRRIAGQLLQMDAFCPALPQELLDHLAAVNGRAIPEDQELAREMPEQMPQEDDHLLSMEGCLPDHVEELALDGDGTDGREMIIGKRDVQDGRRSARSIGSHATRQEVEARLVYPDDSGPVGLRLFLSAGHRSSYQVWIASSLRWVARSMGCWGVQSSARRSRLTWA